MDDRNVRRFYFNVKPENAAELADHLVSELNRLGMQFEFKMPMNIADFTRPDAGVLYVQTSNYQAARGLVESYARKHPKTFVEGYPAFTKPIAKGVAVAEQPIQAGLPAAAEGLHSFESARSDIIAEAIVQAPANVTTRQMKQLVRERLKHYGIDPDRPWLVQGARFDDLGHLPRSLSADEKGLPAIGIVTRLLIGEDLGSADSTKVAAE